MAGTAASNSFTFTGRETDGTRLMFYRARYYDPQRQRFVSADPIGFSGGVNHYAYVRNAPTLFVDPLGLKRRSSGPEGPGGGGPGAGGPGGPGAGGGGDGSGSGSGDGDPNEGDNSDDRSQCSPGTAQIGFTVAVRAS